MTSPPISKAHNCKYLLKTKHATEILQSWLQRQHQWRNRREGRCEPLRPWQAKCKNWASFTLYFGMRYAFSFHQVVVFMRFSECFPVISGFSIDIHTWIQWHFPTFSECLLVGPIQLILALGSNVELRHWTTLITKH